MLAMLGVFTAPATAAPPATDANAKIEGTVAKALAAKDSADFWVMFSQTADLSGPSAVTDWAARGAAVVDALRQTADASQAQVRAELDAQKVSYQSFYIVNAIRVNGGSTALAQSLAKRGDVTNILATRTYEIPKPAPSKATGNGVNAVEWGVAAINADDVWATFGVRGEGIVVANIDTGVDYTHNALVGKYRGNMGGGSFDHNYNWFDPSHVCPSAAPCDNNGHGSHTMGTMVGDDGAANQIGVAPGARFVAAKGCESNSCSDAALLGSGQWVLAPTDLNDANPRPDLRPNIVNNSWGSANGSAVDPFYKATVQAWRASGIFPAFSNGNDGQFGCDTSGSPGDYTETYASGAFDINGNIASFSSRGPGENGMIKPNLSAPGVNVRSSVPGNGYANFNGTSMASPHTAATVALMWSAAPSLIGDYASTAAILNATATDTSDLTCGGTPANNNVWGEGKLNAFTAVEQSPRGPVGTLNGTVTDAANGNPLSGANVHITGPSNRDIVTGATGTYSSTLPVGSYALSVSKFGYGTGTGTATVTEGQTTTLNFALSLVTNGNVTGIVRDSRGVPVANAKVEILATPIAPVTTAADGSYSFPNVPVGTYQAKASAGGCNDQQTQALNVTGNVTLDFTLPNRRDLFGHFCVLEGPNYVEGDTPVALTGDDTATTIPLPFDFFYYGTNYRTVHLGSNGHINFLAQSTNLSNVALPSAGAPNASIYAFWDDLLLDSASRVNTKLSGAAPSREFVIEYRNVMFFGGATTSRVDFETVLAENGQISLRYRNLDPAVGRETGNSATVGIENAAGTDALQFSFNASVLTDSQSIRFVLPPNGVVDGTVTDFNDGQPVAGATVRALKGTDVVTSTTAGADGKYRLRLLAGEYTIEVAKSLYVSSSATVTVGDDTVSTNNAALHTPRAEIQGGPLKFLAQTGQLRTATINLLSTSELDLNYSLTSSASWLWTVPGSVTVPAGTAQPLTVRVDPVGLVPGRVYNATIDLTTNAGRTPSLSVPVTLVVPGYRKGVDSGATGAFTDGNADAWVADQAWAPGGFGYIGPGFVESTNRAIAGTDDDQLYKNQRSGMAAYKFDNLPAGTYTVELDFAELRPNFTAGKRVFDVSINGTTVLPGYDVTAAVGTLAADRKTFNVTVAQGGSIDVFFGSRKGKQPPIVNSLRVTHRPDL